MFNIGDFFKRIGGFQAQQIAAHIAVQMALKEIVAIEVPIYDITFKSGGVVLKNIPHSARSLIYMKKARIIEKANSLQTLKVIQDIH